MSELEKLTLCTVWIADVNEVEADDVVSGVLGAGAGLMEAVEIEATSGQGPQTQKLKCATHP